MDFRTVKRIIDETSSLRKGYYNYTINLSSANGDKTSPYIGLVMVTELEKYKNDYSKIKVDSINIISGYNIQEYEYVKSAMFKKFSPIKVSSEITWLEEEIPISKIRKEKLDAFLKKTQK